MIPWINNRAAYDVGSLSCVSKGRGDGFASATEIRLPDNALHSRQHGVPLR